MTGSQDDGQLVHRRWLVGNGNLDHPVGHPQGKFPQIAIGRAKAAARRHVEPGAVQRAHHRAAPDPSGREQCRLMGAAIIDRMQPVLGAGDQHVPAGKLGGELALGGEFTFGDERMPVFLHVGPVRM